MSTPERQRDRRMIRELRDRLNAWDPLRVLPRRDEYDCLHAPILRALRNGASAGDLASVLHRQLMEHFGISEVEGEHEAATELVAWYADWHRSG